MCVCVCVSVCVCVCVVSVYVRVRACLPVDHRAHTPLAWNTPLIVNRLDFNDYNTPVIL